MMALAWKKRGFGEDISGLWPPFGLHFGNFGPQNRCFFLPAFGKAKRRAWDGLWMGLGWGPDIPETQAPPMEGRGSP